MNVYLLDTNHCSRLLQGHPRIVERLSSLDDALVVTCVIVQGELVYMAQKSEQRAANLLRVQSFLHDIDVYPVDDEAANIYGRLKAAILERFGPKEKARRRQARPESLGFTDNDLWIAAIAKRHGCTIVSADSDFNRVAEIDDLAVEAWWSPELDQKS